MLITQHLPAIVNLVGSHPTVSVVSSTGSGKSIGVPAAIAATGARCFVVVPTRTAAVSLCEYQRSLQRVASPGSDIDKLVGYAAEGNVNYGPETVIAYVTGGHMRKKLLSYFSNGVASPIDFCEVILTDEIHSGSVDTTIVISLWMAASTQVLVPRLVVASATPVPMTIEPEPVVYTIDIPAFPIEIKYLDRDIDIDDPGGAIYIEAAKVAADVHKTTSIDTGHILIFAPGASEVENVAESLKEYLKDFVGDKIVDIIPAFGALKQEDIALIYKQTAPNERKIVIATNIAEMSITINDVGHVIDTMAEKRAETSQSGGFRLTTHYISKDSAKQRMGRTGRTRSGVCYRMCTLERFEKLEDHRPPEIQRVPIYETIMELLDVGLSPDIVIKDIDTDRIVQATKLLTRIGMVTDTGAGLLVTTMGHFSPKFHISVRNAAFLWHWIEAGYPVFPGIVTASLIDSYGPSYFWLPRRKSDMAPAEYNILIKDYKEKHFAKYVGYNDLETCLNMWNDFMSTVGTINPTQKAIINWSRVNSINNKKIRELLKVIQQSIKAAVRYGFQVQIGPFTMAGVMKAARPLLLRVYSDTTLIHRRDVNYFNPLTREEYRLDNRDALNQFSTLYPKGIIALVTAEIKTQRGTFRIIGFGVDTDVDGTGRPIVTKDNQTQQRGQRTITHPRSQKHIISAPNVDNALDLLSTLNIGTQTTNAALDLLATLNTGELTPDAFDLLSSLNVITDFQPDIIPPIIVEPPILSPPVAQTRVRSPSVAQTRVRSPSVAQTRVRSPPVAQTRVRSPPVAQTRVGPPVIQHRVRSPVVPQATSHIQLDQPKFLSPVVEQKFEPNMNDILKLMETLELDVKRTHNNITLLSIDNASDQQLVDLAIIGSDPKIYNNIGVGNPWDIKYIMELREYAIKDLANNNEEYLHWLILQDGVVVGYIGIHPTGSKDFPGSQLRTFVSPKEMGKGIATSALFLLTKSLRPMTLWSFIEPNNIASIRVKHKTGFVSRGQVILQDKVLNVYYKVIE